MSNYGEIEMKIATAPAVVAAELDLDVRMIDETVARMPYCAVKMPYCSLKLNAKEARVLVSL
jgi:hypothetical protein